MGTSVIGEDDRLRRAAGIHSLRLGDMRVSYVPDGAVQGKPLRWLPGTTNAIWAEHPQYLDPSGHLVASLGGLLVEHGDRKLLIDAGFGPRSQPEDPDGPNGAIYGGTLLDSLELLGCQPEQIEVVAFTHLHSDHIGWAVHAAPGDDHPPFANADYLVAELEWQMIEQVDATIATALAGRVRTVFDGQEIFPGVRVRFAAGHTPGHAEYIMTSGGRRLIAFGDALHSPIQVDHPEWSCVYDHEPIRSAEHRRHLIAELERPDTIGFGVHFADVVFGRVRRDGSGSEPGWRPLRPE